MSRTVITIYLTLAFCITAVLIGTVIDRVGYSPAEKLQNLLLALHQLIGQADGHVKQIINAADFLEFKSILFQCFIVM
jgi:hypothetical protein